MGAKKGQIIHQRQKLSQIGKQRCRIELKRKIAQATSDDLALEWATRTLTLLYHSFSPKLNVLSVPSFNILKEMTWEKRWWRDHCIDWIKRDCLDPCQAMS